MSDVLAVPRSPSRVETSDNDKATFYLPLTRPFAMLLGLAAIG
jgi:hypothetical protein